MILIRFSIRTPFLLKAKSQVRKTFLTYLIVDIERCPINEIIRTFQTLKFKNHLRINLSFYLEFVLVRAGRELLPVLTALISPLLYYWYIDYSTSLYIGK